MVSGKNHFFGLFVSGLITLLIAALALNIVETNRSPVSSEVPVTEGVTAAPPTLTATPPTPTTPPTLATQVEPSASSTTALEPPPTTGDPCLRLPYEQRQNVPILMYHVVSDEGNNDLYLSPQHFREHLDCLRELGITPITMQQLYKHWEEGYPLPAKPLVLTFDDGYRSMYTNVLPMMSERGYTGTFYLIVNALESPWNLTAGMVKEMVAAGMEIGSHSMTHADLAQIDAKQLPYQMGASKVALEELCGCAITSFCYPAGKYNEAAVREAGRSGYLTAVTTQAGLASRAQGLHTLRRVRINRGCDGKKLRAILAGCGY